MLRRIMAWLGGGTELPVGREITAAEVAGMMQLQIDEQRANLDRAYRALYRAGELVETLGNGTRLCRLDAPPFKTEAGAQLEALGNAIKRMAHQHVTDIEANSSLHTESLQALQVLQDNSHRYNRQAGGSKTKSDVEAMLMIAERVFVDEDQQAGAAAENG